MEYRELSPVFGIHYLNLLQSMEHSALERFGLSGREGSFTKILVKEKSYWYFQYRKDGKTERLFLGPDSKELQRAIEEIQEVKSVITGLSKTVLSLNGFRFRGDASKALSGMSDSGLFLSGTVLVGTNAFLAYQNVFGIQWRSPVDVLARGDIDFAQFSKFSVGVPLDVSEKIKEALESMEAHLVWRSLNNKGAPWAFAINNPQGFQIEFLTPHIGEDDKGSKAIPLPWAGVCAQPLRFMDYLIEDAFHAAVLLDKGAVLVNLPDPGRFALHKLIVHERRHTSNIQKKKKDLAQAAAMIGFLAKNHTSLIEDAWTDLLRKHRTWGEIVCRSAANLPEEAKNLPVVSSILHTDFSRKRSR